MEWESCGKKCTHLLSAWCFFFYHWKINNVHIVWHKDVHTSNTKTLQSNREKHRNSWTLMTYTQKIMQSKNKYDAWKKKVPFAYENSTKFNNVLCTTSFEIRMKYNLRERKNCIEGKSMYVYLEKNTYIWNWNGRLLRIECVRQCNFGCASTWTRWKSFPEQNMGKTFSITLRYGFEMWHM